MSARKAAPERAILIVDHGSRRAEANAQLERVALAVRDRAPDVAVEIAHMEIAPPSIADGVDACVAAGARVIVVFPWFLAPGSHALVDVPRLAREAVARHPGVELAVAEPLGLHEKLVDVLLERVAGATSDGRSD